MNRIAWPILVAVLGSAGLCPAQEALTPKAKPAPVPAPISPTLRTAGTATNKVSVTGNKDWILSAGVMYTDITYLHDALQHRSDFSEDSQAAWESGRSSGDGYGARFFVGRNNEGFAFALLQSDVNYDFHTTNSAHHIQTERGDYEITYAKLVESKDFLKEPGFWGWNVGLKYIDDGKTMSIRELGGSTTNSSGAGWNSTNYSSGVSWKMIQAGYFGSWRPLGGPVRVYGQVNGMLGEVSGLCRKGNDLLPGDGVIEDEYRQGSSFAYGLHATLAVAVELYDRLSLTAGYRREWLYSFDATDSGTVVFPDNDDALFIENQHGVFVSINMLF